MYICNKCDHEFKNAENHRRHIAICNGEGTHLERRFKQTICSKCGHLFKSRWNYDKHIAVCTGLGTIEEQRPGEKICEYCNKIFKSNGNYTRHVSLCKRVADIDLQQEYNTGLSLSQIAEKYNVSQKFLINRRIKTRPKHVSTSIQKEKNPSNFFFGGSRQKSKGEEVFKEKLLSSSIGIQVVEQYHLFGYRMDFGFPEIKLDVEIDGMQHYVNLDITNKDIKRDSLLIQNGWTVYRIASKDFLRRPNKVFEVFLDFLKDYPKDPSRTIYNQQITNGDEQWTNERIELIKNSGIDFTKIGWTEKLGALLRVCSATACRWVKKNMPDFYENICRTPRIDFTNRTAKHNGCS